MAKISPLNDPLGNALRDFLAGDHDANLEVLSDIDGTDIWPAALFFRGLAEMPEIEKRALVFCKGDVLDVGAGAGSHALALSDLGHVVSCLDLSHGACEVMRERGLKHVFECPALQFSSGKFDTVLLLMNGIGIAGSLDGYRSLLIHLKSLLNPGGRIIFDSADVREHLKDVEGYQGIVNYRMRYEEVTSEPFPWLYIDPETATEIAFDVGLSLEVLFKDYEYSYLACLKPITGNR